jgi:hypothetical protein
MASFSLTFWFKTCQPGHAAFVHGGNRDVIFAQAKNGVKILRVKDAGIPKRPELHQDLPEVRVFAQMPPPVMVAT